MEFDEATEQTDERTKITLNFQKKTHYCRFLIFDCKQCWQCPSYAFIHTLDMHQQLVQ